MIEPLYKRTFADIPIFEFASVTSTQDVAQYCAQGYNSMIDLSLGETEQDKLYSVFRTDFQSEGRGRRDRAWESTPGTSMMATFVFGLRPQNPYSQVLRLLVCVMEALREKNVDITIKWPNDLVIEDSRIKKLGGCLSEIENNFLFVGLGVNILSQSYPPALSEDAISLEELGLNILPNDLLDGIVHRLSISNDDEESLVEKYKKASNTLGKEVEVAQVNSVLTGIAKDVDIDGALIIETADKKRVKVFEGDVTSLRGV